MTVTLIRCGLVTILMVVSAVVVSANLRRCDTVDLNGDCVLDTLTVERVGRSEVLLREIRWGSRSGRGYCDSNYYSDTSVKYHAVTIIRFAKADLLSTGHSILRFNQDDAKDLLINVSWSTDTAANSRKMRRANKSFVFVIPAQRGIDTLDTLNINVFSGLITSPIVMRRIKASNGLDSVATSADLTVIHKIKRKNIQVALNDDAGGALIGTVVSRIETPETALAPILVRVFPNPASADEVTVGVKNLTGVGTVRVFDEVGQVLRVWTTSYEGTGETDVMLDVFDFPVGMYRVLVIEDGGRIGTSNFAIVR